ncbi:HNH endonuclease [Aliiroseovarius zhejiangensis]|uniref:HNH endonuclease n=1 Tax=Aliiroseovarius zhejiangensis TaxID=1632025 RepID=UPI00174E66D4|nr:HNH endonuclease [Aliiroseovarius zhejiangensis]
MRCIYCQELLSEDTESNRRSSKEHIIPESLGGRSPAITKDCCVKCNSDLGTCIDGPFQEQFFVKFLQLSNSVKSKKGKFQKASFPVRAKGFEDEIGKVTFHDAGLTTKLLPIVRTTDHDEGSFEVSISGEIKEARNILGNIISKRFRRARSSEINPAILEEMLNSATEKAVSKEIREFSTSMELDLVSLEKGLAKIALGTAHLFLGPSWTFSDSSRSIRAVMDADAYDPRLIEAVVVSYHPEFRNSLVGETVWRLKEHFLAAIPLRDEIIVIVSIFGDPTLTRCYQISFPASPRGRNVALRIPLTTSDPVEWYKTTELLFIKRIVLQLAAQGVETAIIDAVLSRL